MKHFISRLRVASLGSCTEGSDFIIMNKGFFWLFCGKNYMHKREEIKDHLNTFAHFRVWL